MQWSAYKAAYLAVPGEFPGPSIGHIDKSSKNRLFDYGFDCSQCFPNIRRREGVFKIGEVQRLTYSVFPSN